MLLAVVMTLSCLPTMAFGVFAEEADPTEPTELILEEQEETVAPTEEEPVAPTDEPTEAPVEETVAPAEETVAPVEETVVSEKQEKPATRAPADNECGEKLTWKLEDDVLTISGEGAMFDYSEDPAPWSGEYVEKVVLEKGVTTIGAYAFEGMTDVVELSLPTTLLTIDAYAFSGCSGLNTVKLPESLQGIGNSAFADCDGLTGTLTIPGNVAIVGNSAFAGCVNITGVTVGSGLTVLNTNVFADCENLKTVKLVSGLTQIKSGAFSGCTALKSIVIPESVKRIEEGAFIACTGLESITLPFTGGALEMNQGDICYPFGYIFGTTDYADSMAVKQRYYTNTETPTYFFATYYIPNSLTKVVLTGGDIRPYAFYHWTGLESVTLSDATAYIGNYSFAGCDSLEEIVLPGSLKHIGEGAYDGCAALKTIWYEGTQRQLDKVSIGDNNAPLEDVEVFCIDNAGSCGENVNWVLDENGKLIITGTGEMEDYADWIYVPWYDDRASVKEVIIKDGVTSIGGYAFYGHVNLTKVTIADSVESIGEAAFRGCAAVSTIALPDIVTSIGDEAFYGCAKLSGELTLPAGLVELGDSAYKNCRKITGCVTIPAGVESVGAEAFAGCNGLTEVILEDGVLSIGDNAFNSCCDLIDVQIPDSVESIGDGAFADCANLETVTLPDALLDLGDAAFSGCISLNEIILPSALTTIGDEAFFGCIALTEVEIHDGITTIGDKAFAECVSLATVIVPSVDVELGEGIFMGCESIEAFTVPAAWTNVGDRMFEGCLNLAEVIFEGTPERIGNGAFYQCVSLEILELPDGITELGDGVFYGCEALEGTFVIPDSVEKLGKNLFEDCVNLTEVVLPVNLTEIPEGLLHGCNCIDAIVIPATVTAIGAHAFDGCVLVDEIELPDGLKSIGDYAFADLANLKALELPATLKSIGDYAFSNLTALTELKIPSGVTEIGEGAFNYCVLVTQINIPSGVKAIEDKTFANCLSLVSVTIPYSVEEIGADIFVSCAELNHVLFAGLQSQWDDIVIHESNTALLGDEKITFHLKAKGNEVTAEWTGTGLYGYCSICDEEMDFGPVDVSTCLIYMDQEVVYTGSYIRPQVFVYTVWGEQLTFNEDYTVSYSNNKNIGKAVVTVTGKGDCEGKCTTNFVILPPVVKNVKVASTTGTTVKITYDGVLPASHYDIYLDGVQVDSTSSRYYTFTELTPGQAYEVNVVAAKSIGDDYYQGDMSSTIVVRPTDSISNYSASLEYTAVGYDGATKEPNVTLKNGKGELLVEGDDYVVSYDKNRNIGKASVTITGMGAYRGTISKTFTINPEKVENLEVVDMTSSSVTISFDPVPGATEYWIYRGDTRRAKITDTTYKTTGLSVGTTYKFYVKAVAEVGSTDYIGESSETVSAKPTYTVDDYTFTVTNGPLTYTGKSVTPSVRLKSKAGKTLKLGTDYTIECKNNVNIGTATVTATGKGKYSETITTTFEIVPAKVTDLAVKVIDGDTVEISYKASEKAQWYEIFANGTSVGVTTKTKININGMIPGKTYKITVSAGATVDGDDYQSEQCDSKSVKPVFKLSDCDIALENDKFVYTGKWIRPAVSVELDGVELIKDQDYTLKYRNNMNTGKAYVEVVGKNGFTGTVKKEFTINPVQITGVKVKSTTEDSVKLTFKKSASIKYYEVYLDGVYRGKTTGSTYTLNNLDTGKVYEVVMKGLKTVNGEDYYGMESDPIYVWAGTSISGCYAKLEYTTAVYEGYALYPDVVVKTSSRSSAKTLVEGVDYFLEYSENDAPGKATVRIHGAWGSDYTGTLTKTFTIKPAKVENVSAIALSKSSIQVDFDAVDGATSYWVYVNGYRKAKITDTSCVIKNLSRNRTYSVTVKAVTTVSGTNYTGATSDTFKVKTLS